MDEDTVGRKPLIARVLAVAGIAALAGLPIALPVGTQLATPPAIADPAPGGPSPNPSPAPAPKRHLWCMVTGGAGRGISYSKVCWYRTY